MIIKKANNNTLFLIIISIILISLLIVIEAYVKKEIKTQPFTQKTKQETLLQSIQITIKEKHYNKLKKKRNKAIAAGVLESDDNDYVPALITFQGEDYKARIRLKGDWTDHLEGDKWSFRIKLKGDKTILGMRKFSIHHPKARGYINDWLFHKIHKKEGLMGLRYSFAEGFLHIKHANNKAYTHLSLGIYAIEEAFDKRTIESNQRKEGIILRFSEKNYWKEVKSAHKIENQLGYPWLPVLSPTFNHKTSGYISTFGLNRILKKENLHKQFIQAKNMLNAYDKHQLKTSDVFDCNKLAMHTALTNLFGATHGFAKINTRIYYNPTTNLFEPISSDGNSGYAQNKFRYYFNTQIKTDTVFTKALIKAFEKVSKKEYLDSLFYYYRKDINYLESALEKEFNSKAIIKIENYKKNQSLLKKELVKLKRIIQ